MRSARRVAAMRANTRRRGPQQAGPPDGRRSPRRFFCGCIESGYRHEAEHENGGRQTIRPQRTGRRRWWAARTPRGRRKSPARPPRTASGGRLAKSVSLLAGQGRAPAQRRGARRMADARTAVLTPAASGVQQSSLTAIEHSGSVRITGAERRRQKVARRHADERRECDAEHRCATVLSLPHPQECPAVRGDYSPRIVASRFVTSSTRAAAFA